MTRCVVIRHIGIRWDCFREEEEESEEGLKVAMIFWFFFWGGGFSNGRRIAISKKGILCYSTGLESTEIANFVIPAPLFDWRRGGKVNGETTFRVRVGFG